MEQHFSSFSALLIRHVTSDGIDIKELGGGSDVEMFEILPRD